MDFNSSFWTLSLLFTYGTVVLDYSLLVLGMTRETAKKNPFPRKNAIIEHTRQEKCFVTLSFDHELRQEASATFDGLQLLLS